MYLLKLFHQSDPARPIGARMSGTEGVISVGRDANSDWLIEDEEREVSRTHFELHVRGGRLTVRPLGSNGVFAGASSERLDSGQDHPLSVGDRIRFGKYLMQVDATPLASGSGAQAARTMILAAPFGTSAAIPSEWEDADDRSYAPSSSEASLLEAFCEGAKLDSSAFSTEDPAEVMRRAGMSYRQMVIGLAALMSERSAAKARIHIDRTTICAKDNNPFKWAPTQRLAIDLLLNKDRGFLTAADAIRASFEDIKKHLISAMAGYQAALQAMVRTTEPDRIQQGAKGRLLQNREAAAWNKYKDVHRDLSRQILEDHDGPINQAFVGAYNAKMRELDEEAKS
jgi:predicted component of type VI protein secretion system